MDVQTTGSQVYGHTCAYIMRNIFSTLVSTSSNNFYVPKFGEVEGAYCFGVLRVCVHDSVYHTFLMHAISYEPCMLGF